jgi:hypothetical protein
MLPLNAQNWSAHSRQVVFASTAGNLPAGMMGTPVPTVYPKHLT